MPSLLTQSLEVLHRSLMALQWRVGLRGLIQEHLQSCEHQKMLKCNFSLGDESDL